MRLLRRYKFSEALKMLFDWKGLTLSPKLIILLFKNCRKSEANFKGTIMEIGITKRKINLCRKSKSSCSLKRKFILNWREV